MAMIVDEYGSLEGIATPTDVLEAIAGEFPDMNEEAATLARQEDGSWLVDGFIDVRQLSGAIRHDLVDDANRYATLGGYILTQLGHLPSAGETFDSEGLRFEIVSFDKHSIGKVRIIPV
jgi:CBS domain containing-hemolysin-like protein